jgi:hypothetical protein
MSAVAATATWRYGSIDLLGRIEKRGRCGDAP